MRIIIITLKDEPQWFFEGVNGYRKMAIHNRTGSVYWSRGERTGVVFAREHTCGARARLGVAAGRYANGRCLKAVGAGGLGCAPAGLPASQFG